jgi:hypothetical protein
MRPTDRNCLFRRVRFDVCYSAALIGILFTQQPAYATNPFYIFGESYGGAAILLYRGEGLGLRFTVRVRVRERVRVRVLVRVPEGTRLDLFFLM